MGGIYGYDYVRSRSFHMEVVAVSPEKPVASTKERVTVTVKLTRRGQAVEGHTLYALALDGGTMRGNRIVTDGDGIAVFTYVPYTSSRLMPAMPVRIEVSDESNSVFFEVNAKLLLTVDLQEPERSGA